MTETQVVIVGAGITGLALDRELHRRGVETRVLEAAGRAGGVVRSVRADGRVLDAGPQRTRLVPSVARLVDELGLEDRLLRGDPDLPLFVCRQGRLRRVPFSPGEFVATDLLTVRGKLRMLLEPLLPGAREGPRPRETVEAFVTRKLGREAYLRLVGPLYGGIYASDPGEMLVEHSLGRALERAGLDDGSLVLAAARWAASRGEPPPPVTFADGMQELTDALGRRAGDRLVLSRPVVDARRAGDATGAGGRWEVVTAEGPVRAGEVVLTCPADEAARILAGEAPDVAGRLDRLRYNPIGVVHLSSACDLEGYGYQMALPEDTATRGVTWNASLFGRDGVYTAYLGGALRPEAMELSDRDLGEVARREFREVTGCDARVLRVGRTRMPARDRSWTAMEGLAPPAGIRLCAAYTGRAGIPGRLEAARRTAEAIAGGAGGGAVSPPPGR